ncbi:ABC transporter permease [Echinimonas agarilytica]|uniref:Iron ABC transporter permease n=1 Tax=Echinimonas agarilytica TaxID=1215918 RepID=A0AA41W3H3_9GAMM|nr:iron ABC transporter permease [Echinimonas agarilytica]MCM2678106.1 iron ABC transporter permease [Echinimonas agarilytica]
MRRFSSISWSALGIATVLASPILCVLYLAFTSPSDVWVHLYETVLGDYVSHSLVLMVGVTLGTLLLGVPTAWLTANCQFPMHRICNWFLVLPMAMPAYIVAYAYSGMLGDFGPVQTWIRNTFEVQYGQYWFPDIHSVGGAIIVLSLVLYPYVYLLARSAFLDQRHQFNAVAQTLGSSVWRNIWKVALPLARPAIAAGVLLALMETMSDYGTVQYFGVSTFTTGIFRTYYGFGDESATAQLSLVLLVVVLVLYAMEKRSRKGMSFHALEDSGTTSAPLKLRSWNAGLALLLCLLPCFLGFILPFTVLFLWGLESTEWFDSSFMELSVNSIMLASLAAMITVLLALVLCYAARLHRSWWITLSIGIASLGYALPGTIIAIGVIVLLTALDHSVVTWIASLFGIDSGLLLSGSLVALVFAFAVRFMTIAVGSISSGMMTIKPTLDASARLLGRTPWQVVRQIHAPLLRPSVLTAALIVFVDVMKELPATLILRPFNFNTLSVRAYEMASDERLYDAGPSALLMVLAGLIPVLLLNRNIIRNSQ